MDTFADLEDLMDNLKKVVVKVSNQSFDLIDAIADAKGEDGLQEVKEMLVALDLEDDLDSAVAFVEAFEEDMGKLAPKLDEFAGIFEE